MSLYDDASLIMYPSGYKEDKLYSLKPTDGSGDFTFTRASSATRVNSEGLIEEVPYNLVQYSEQFDNTYWTKSNATIIANSTIAPNGTTTADTLSVNVVNYSGFRRAITGVSANYNISIYAKKNTKNWLYIINTTGSGAKAWFDLDSGVLGTVVSGYTATITSVGDGWYRCTLANNTAETLGYYQMGLADANNAIIPTASGSAYIWGAQLSSGSTAKTYFPTTDRLNVPRLDYSGGASCASLLLEPQRTNQWHNSNDFTQSSWIATNVTISLSSEISPDGTLNAYKITDDSTNGEHRIRGNSFFVPSGANFSIFAKAAEYGNFAIANLSDGFTINFDLINGTILSVGSGWSNAKIENYGNGWYRLSGSVSVNKTCGYALLNDSGDFVFSGAGTKGVHIWGAQFEDSSSYPTSYIPTSGSTVTRTADACNGAGTSATFNDSEGVLMAEISALANDNVLRKIQVNDNTLNNNITIDYYTSSNSIRANLWNGSSQYSYIHTLTDVTLSAKVAFLYKSSEFKFYVNGIKVNESSSGSTFSSGTLQTLDLSASNGSSPFYGNVKQLQYYDSALTDSELETLTSWTSFNEMAQAQNYTII